MLICVGYIEVGCDLVCLVGFEFLFVIVEILNVDGIMVCCLDFEVFVKEYGLKIGIIVDLIEYRNLNEIIIECVVKCKLLIDYGEFDLVIYKDIIDG